MKYQNNLYEEDNISTTNQKINKENSNTNKNMSIVSYEQAPDFQKDNEYIKSGYLINCNSPKKITKSLFILHNESINIWTHLLGVILVIIFIVYTSIFITSYKTQIMNIKYNFEKIKSFGKYFQEVDKKLKDLKIQFDKKFNLTDFTYFIEKFNSSIYSMKNVNNNNVSNSLSRYYEKLLEQITNLKKYLIPYKELKLQRWPIFIMLFSAILCLSFSSTYHLIGIMSKKINSFSSRLDYGGISILIAGSCYPPYYYFFHCDYFFRNIYLSFISIFSICVFFYSLTSDFYLPKRRTFRGILFLILGLSTAIPVIHLIFFNRSIKGFMGGPRLIYWYFGGFSYVIGALIYINRIPEKCYPGKFDIFGSSHQFFHCFVVLGVIFHYLGCLDAYYYRFDAICPV